MSDDESEPELTFSQRARRLIETRKIMRRLPGFYQPDGQEYSFPRSALEIEADRIELQQKQMKAMFDRQQEQAAEHIKIMEAEERGRLEGARMMAYFAYNRGKWPF